VPLFTSGGLGRKNLFLFFWRRSTGNFHVAYLLGITALSAQIGSACYERMKYTSCMAGGDIEHKQNEKDTQKRSLQPGLCGDNLLTTGGRPPEESF